MADAPKEEGRVSHALKYPHKFKGKRRAAGDKVEGSRDEIEFLKKRDAEQAAQEPEQLKGGE